MKRGYSSKPEFMDGRGKNPVLNVVPLYLTIHTSNAIKVIRWVNAYPIYQMILLNSQ